MTVPTHAGNKKLRAVFDMRLWATTLVHLSGFDDASEALFTNDELGELTTYLALNPTAGALIPSTGGIRKLRWGAKGRGKRGGARVIYYYHSRDIPIFLLDAYGKGEKDDLTAAESGTWGVS
jgi:hypothetical protein